MKARRCADVVAFPGPHLQNQVVGIGARNEIAPEVLDDLRQAWRPAKARLRHSSRRHHSCENSQPAHTMPNAWMPRSGCARVIATIEGGVGGQCRDLAFEPNDAVAIGPGGARSRDDAIHRIRVAHRPLESPAARPSKIR